MVYLPKKRQMNGRFHSQLIETADDFGKRNTSMKTENTGIFDGGDENVISHKVNHPTARNASRVNMQTL